MKRNGKRKLRTLRAGGWCQITARRIPAFINCSPRGDRANSGKFPDVLAERAEADALRINLSADQNRMKEPVRMSDAINASESVGDICTKANRFPRLAYLAAAGSGFGKAARKTGLTRRQIVR